MTETAPLSKTPRTALIIPTLNEVESIQAVIAEVPRRLVDRIIVADGGSTDGTVARALAAGAEVIHAGCGYGRACQAGAEAASDADILVFMDGDGADDPRAIEFLTAPIDAGTADFVLGSRTLGTAVPGSMGWHQRVAGRGIGLALRAAYGVGYTDMCALRAIRRDRLFALGMAEMTYGWNLEMQMRAAREGLRIVEIPVHNRRRAGGRSKVAGTLRGSWKAGTRIIATFARLLRDPPREARRPRKAVP